MIKREVLLPPVHIYPIDDWKLIEQKYDPNFLAQNETMFAVGNGYIGMRGNFEEGAPFSQNGTFVNGFHETWPIVYGEDAFGFAKTGQTMLNVPDAKTIKLYVDDEPFYLPTADLLEYERTLNMKSGAVDRELIWEMPSGKKVSIKSKRLVSFKHRHIAAISYEVTVLNAETPVVISSQLLIRQENQASEGDPRQAKGFDGSVLNLNEQIKEDCRIVLGFQTKKSRMTLGCGIDHKMTTKCKYTVKSDLTENGLRWCMRSMQSRVFPSPWLSILLIFPQDGCRLLNCVNVPDVLLPGSQKKGLRNLKQSSRSIWMIFGHTVMSILKRVTRGWHRRSVLIFSIFCRPAQG